MRLRTGPDTAPGRGPSRSALMLALSLCLATLFLTARPVRAQPAAPAPAAANQRASDALAINDPFESLNRRGYAVHRFLDQAVLKPLALGYEHKAPRPLQKILHNLVVEISEPVVFSNDVLQFRLARAGGTAVRFLTNASVGVLGLFDPATKWGFPHHENGFGVTLGVYGVPSGPYLFIPLVGPSTIRDLFGEAVDFYSDPISRIHYYGRTYVMAGVWLIGGIDQRANAEGDLEQIDQMGTDSYATMRSLYLQNRRNMITGGQVSIQDLPQFDDGSTGSTAPDASSAPSAQTEPAGASPAGVALAPQPPVSAPANSGPDAAYFLTPPPPKAPSPPGPPLQL